jgi:hypothetical protein
MPLKQVAGAAGRGVLDGVIVFVAVKLGTVLADAAPLTEADALGEGEPLDECVERAEALTDEESLDECVERAEALTDVVAEGLRVEVAVRTAVAERGPAALAEGAKGAALALAAALAEGTEGAALALAVPVRAVIDGAADGVESCVTREGIALREGVSAGDLVPVPLRVGLALPPLALALAVPPEDEPFADREEVGITDREPVGVTLCAYETRSTDAAASVARSAERRGRYAARHCAARRETTAIRPASREGWVTVAVPSSERRGRK